MEKFGFETDTVDLDFKDPWSESKYTKGICERYAGIFFLNLIGEVKLALQKNSYYSLFLHKYSSNLGTVKVAKPNEGL